MNIAVLLVRVLLGLVFLVFGLNGFLEFLDQPVPEDPRAVDFMTSMVNTGYMMPLLKGTEVACGALLVAGILVPLALTVLAPVLVNIVAYHFFLDPGPGLYMAIGLVALELFLAWSYREHFTGLLNPFARPVRHQKQA